MDGFLPGRGLPGGWRGGVVCSADGARVPGGLWAARSGGQGCGRCGPGRAEGWNRSAFAKAAARRGSSERMSGAGNWSQWLLWEADAGFLPPRKPERGRDTKSLHFLAKKIRFSLEFFR